MAYRCYRWLEDSYDHLLIDMGNGNGHDTRKIPITGAAGEAVYAALLHLSTHCGECGVTIKKERVAGGGYVYTIGNHEPPVKPARGVQHGH